MGFIAKELSFNFHFLPIDWISLATFCLSHLKKPRDNENIYLLFVKCNVLHTYTQISTIAGFSRSLKAKLINS
jgi:hypothetical protein